MRDKPPFGPVYKDSARRELERLADSFEREQANMQREQKTELEFIRKAARLGSKGAQEFLDSLKQ